MDGHLPPLGTLRLGTPTAMDAAPASRRQRTLRSDTDGSGQETVITNVPGDALMLVIAKAGVEARKSQNPPQEICEWMKNFCRAAKYQGQTCEDLYYWSALTGFGIEPLMEGSGADAVSAVLPSYSGFQSWRQLFAALCEAYYGTDQPVSNGPVEDFLAWHEGVGPFWNSVKGVMGGGPVNTEFVMRFINPDANKRELDTLINGLFMGYSAMKFFQRRTGESMAQVAIRSREQNRRVKEMYYEWKRGNPSQFRVDTSPWMAMVTLLDMRGGEPFQLEKYRAIDRELYAAVKWQTTIENLDLVTPQAMAENFEQVRDALDRYADPNYDGALEPHIAPFGAPSMPRPPCLLVMAMNNSDGKIIKLLLDHGMKLPVRYHMKQEAFDRLVFVTMFTSWSHWRVDQETTMTLINLFRPWINSHMTPGAASGQRLLDRKYFNDRIDHALSPDRNAWLDQRPEWLLEAWRSLKYVPPPRRVRPERA